MNIQTPLLTKLNKYGEEGKKRMINGDEVAKLIAGYKDLCEFIPNSNSNAILEPLNTQRKPLEHKRLKQFILDEFDLFKFGLTSGNFNGLSYFISKYLKQYMPFYM